jgi:hypothetical protein
MSDSDDRSDRVVEPSVPGGRHGDDRRDGLISRVIDGEASEADWSALRTLAGTDPSVWTDITETQRQHEALCLAVDEAGSMAEDVELPERELLTPAERFERRMDAFRAWGGWAAAAAILLVWFTGVPSGTLGGGGTQSAGLGPTDWSQVAPEEALERYIDRGRQTGRVLAEVPERVVLETRPLERGEGLEVVYLRQILEREIVDPSRMYRMGQNEFGQAAIVPTRAVREAAPARRVSY